MFSFFYQPALKHLPPKKPRKLNKVSAQHGFVLVISLLLLLVISVVGILIVQGTSLQHKMANASYDREINFQNAEAALRVAAQSVVTQPGLIARNCQAGGVVCLINPFADPNLPTGSIHTLDTGTYTAGTNTEGQPQYVIEDMGNWTQAQSDTGFNQTSNVHNYGIQGASATAVYYRITARSGDPNVVGSRAVVTIQATVKQGI